MSKPKEAHRHDVRQSDLKSVDEVITAMDSENRPSEASMEDVSSTAPSRGELRPWKETFLRFGPLSGIVGMLAASVTPETSIWNMR